MHDGVWVGEWIVTPLPPDSVADLMNDSLLSNRQSSSSSPPSVTISPNRSNETAPSTQRQEDAALDLECVIGAVSLAVMGRPPNARDGKTERATRRPAVAATSIAPTSGANSLVALTSVSVVDLSIAVLMNPRNADSPLSLSLSLADLRILDVAGNAILCRKCVITRSLTVALSHHVLCLAACRLKEPIRCHHADSAHATEGGDKLTPRRSPPPVRRTGCC